ncbi:MAG: hypothetical protein ABIG39_06790 [Candidatus Micrarchaeota archaeon]
MEPEQIVYEKLNTAWKSTCKIIFGEEVGELRDYEDWLKEYVVSPKVQKSSVSGKLVSFAVRDYPASARFITFDEIDFNKKFEPLTINEVKDIDGIVEALNERFYYAGDIILGNSHFIEKSSNVVDSNYVYNSVSVSDSKYIGYCDMVKLSGYEFGVYGSGESNHAIKCVDFYGNQRIFECHSTNSSSDCYYSANLQNCREGMFSFGAKSKSCLIGNTQLPKDKYHKLKTKLLAEMVDILRKEKEIFSLLQIIKNSNNHPAEIRLDPSANEEMGNREPIEKAFSKTTDLILGRELKDIDSYSTFLKKHVPDSEVLISKSALSGDRVLTSGAFSRLFRPYEIIERRVMESEIRKVGEIGIEKEKIEAFSMDGEVLSKHLHPIAYIAFNSIVGNNRNIIDSAIITNSENCYNGTAYVFSKLCGYCFWPRNSERVFGSWSVWDSAFCINSYNSKKLTRTFEVDNCESSSDIYFSHNCENVHNSMFCFNTKNLKNAIGNTPIPLAEYNKLKSSLLEQIGSELEKKKSLKWDIYNIGVKR